jgi:hypothetical protein
MENRRPWFWGLLALAIVLRAARFDPFAMHHPDEILQYLEPAYRLLGNEGIVTWEYRYGMRSWLLPLLLAGPMALGQAIGGSALAGIVAARLAVAAIGLLPVVAAWHLGRRLSPTHGIVAMAVMALWYEQVVFSTHLLTETLGTSLFLAAAALLTDRASRSRMMMAGALLAFAAIFRFHYAVSAAVFVLLALQADWRRWGWLILGAIPVVVLSSAVDLVMGQWPFEWVWINLQLNVVESRSARFGVQHPLFLAVAMWDQWRWAMPLIVALALASGKPLRPLLYAALFNLAVHSLIAHKEYRFIELTSAVLVLLAAIGSVNALRSFERWRGRSTSGPAIMLLLLAWAATSAWLGRNRPLDQGFAKRGAGPELIYLAGRDPHVCGFAGMTSESWQLSRAYLGRQVPIILLDNSFTRPPRLLPPGPELRSVNAVFAPDGEEAVLPGYSVVKCKGEDPWRRCLYVRPGPCTPTPEATEHEVQHVMGKYDI